MTDTGVILAETLVLHQIFAIYMSSCLVSMQKQPFLKGEVLIWVKFLGCRVTSQRTGSGLA